MPKVRSIPLNKLEEDPMNVRSEANIDPTLVEDIKKGQIEPITVRPKKNSDRYLVTVGSRRFAAARAAGLDELKCIVREDLEGKDVEAMYLSCRENAGSEDLPSKDYRNAVKNALKAEGGDPHSEEVVREIAGKLGLSRAKVKEHIKVLELTDEGFGWVLDAAEGELSLGLEALTKSHSDRTDAEQKAVEEMFGESSEDVPNIAEESGEIDSAKEIRSSSLSQKGAVKLSENLDSFSELLPLEQARVILETIVEGYAGVENVISAAEKRASSEEKGKQKKKSTPRGHELAITLTDLGYRLLSDYADFVNNPSLDQTAENIVVDFLKDDVIGQPRITSIREEDIENPYE